MATYYERFSGLDPSQVPIALYRREIDGDVSSDGVYTENRALPFTSVLVLWMLNLGNNAIEQVSEAKSQRSIAGMTARHLA